MARSRGAPGHAPAGASDAPVKVRAEVPFDELDDDRPHVRIRQARRDKIAQRAYDAGRKGRGFSADANSEVPIDELRLHHRRGATDAAAKTRELPDDAADDAGDETAEGDEPGTPPPPARGPASRSRSWGRPNAPQFINDGAGFVLGILGYALFINFVRGGRAQARGWLAAKFLNRPYGQAPSGATMAAPGATVPHGTFGLPVLPRKPAVAPVPAPPSSGGVLGNIGKVVTI